jgi:hypothetical protein
MVMIIVVSLIFLVCLHCMTQDSRLIIPSVNNSHTLKGFLLTKKDSEEGKKQGRVSQ